MQLLKELSIYNCRERGVDKRRARESGEREKSTAPCLKKKIRECIVHPGNLKTE